MTVANDQEVLVFPRKIFDDVFSLRPWETVQDRIEEIEASFEWLERPAAEISREWVQAIPCTLIRDHSGRFCVLRRVNQSRDDLKNKLSLVIGGHIDHKCEDGTFRSAVTANLIRELEEEVGVLTSDDPSPIGVIVDDSSHSASRHVAFVHEILANDVSPDAPEEFMPHSKMSGIFMDARELADRIHRFDPWSRMLIEDYVCRDVMHPEPRQFSLV